MPSPRLSPDHLRLDSPLDPTAYAPLGVLLSALAWRTHAIDGLLDKNARATRQATLQALGDALGDPALLSTAALLMEALRFVAVRHLRLDRPGALSRAMAKANQSLGGAEARRILTHFVSDFPPAPVRDGAAPESWLASSVGEGPHLDALEELILLAVARDNAALAPLTHLFDDEPLQAEVGHRRLTTALLDAIDGEGPVEGAEGAGLWATLTAPHRTHPGDLLGQLRYILSHWTLPEALSHALLRAGDLLEEAHRFRGGDGPGPIEGPGLGAGRIGDEAAERFSPDGDWMSNVVLVAKQTYVWLDQLSRRFRRAISRLDQIPDEVLDELAEAGFTGLWLIGVWTRSTASQAIKRRAGNPDARASAYSLYDYSVADQLGGEGAVDDLRARCAARGIRLAADMVPNHFGLYSRWMLERPDRFLSLDAPPYPNYTFDGPDLCPDPEIGLYLEDGYWDRRDAAVVFKRVDHQTGEARYIYHGNDGTQMPWNDTAQIDYLNPEAREAVIQCILHVARRFPIIRFDAAMTLARRHIQRLWFPPPGEGGAIPSRAARGLTAEDFDEAMPQEFWREVVDRVAQEAPDTLLLAEAFWLMEGYFVRTLGMHRVYNSAFMHMLKDEDNAGYRKSIKEVLAFSPEILKRFVNFMSNPDEETAVEQFGKGEKYFGVCQLMLTLPGLPMLAHGQLEGFAEKYGMEYGRAYWDEAVDEGLLSWHKARIFPLIHRRHLFSEAAHFALYDFHTGHGVDEHVYAFSNRHGDERALVLYHNRYGDTAGHIKLSAPVNVARGGDTHLVQRPLAEALGLRAEAEVLYTFRDHNSGLSFLRTGAELAEGGFYAQLGAYQAMILLDWRALEDPDQHWWTLWSELGGEGIADPGEARWRIILRPLHRALVAPLRTLSALDDDESALAEGLELLQAALKRGPGARPTAPKGWPTSEVALTYLGDWDPEVEQICALSMQVIDLATLIAAMEDGEGEVPWWDHWRLGAVLPEIFGEAPLEAVGPALGHPDAEALGELTLWLARWLRATQSEGEVDLAGLMQSGEATRWLKVNTHQDVRWFNDERMGFLLSVVDALGEVGDPELEQLYQAAQAAQHRYDDLLTGLRHEDR